MRPKPHEKLETSIAAGPCLSNSQILETQETGKPSFAVLNVKVRKGANRAFTVATVEIVEILDRQWK